MKPSTEATLAVKLFKQTISEAQSHAGVKFGLESEEIELNVLMDAARLCGLAKEILDICKRSSPNYVNKHNKKLAIKAIRSVHEILEGYGLKADASENPKYAFVIHFPGEEFEL